jgi:hypothetical protein
MTKSVLDIEFNCSLTQNSWDFMKVQFRREIGSVELEHTLVIDVLCIKIYNRL